VGGLSEKLHGARQAGIRKVLIPAENIGDVPLQMDGLEIIPIKDVQDAYAHIFVK